MNNSQSKTIKYLVDTSVWIEFFRGKNNGIKNRLFQLLDEDRVFVNGIVISELLVGARGQKETDFIKDKFCLLNYLEMDLKFFNESGTLGSKIRKSGINLLLSDLFISTHAKINNLIVFTTDKHFETISQQCGVQYEII